MPTNYLGRTDQSSDGQGSSFLGDQLKTFRCVEGVFSSFLQWQLTIYRNMVLLFPTINETETYLNSL